MLCYRVAERIHSGLKISESLDWGLSLFDNSIEVGLIAMELNGEQIAATNTKMPWTSRVI